MGDGEEGFNKWYILGGVVALVVIIIIVVVASSGGEETPAVGEKSAFEKFVDAKNNLAELITMQEKVEVYLEEKSKGKGDDFKKIIEGKMDSDDAAIKGKAKVDAAKKKIEEAGQDKDKLNEAEDEMKKAEEDCLSVLKKILVESFKELDDDVKNWVNEAISTKEASGEEVKPEEPKKSVLENLLEVSKIKTLAELQSRLEEIKQKAGKNADFITEEEGSKEYQDITKKIQEFETKDPAEQNEADKQLIGEAIKKFVEKFKALDENVQKKVNEDLKVPVVDPNAGKDAPPNKENEVPVVDPNAGKDAPPNKENVVDPNAGSGQRRKM